MTIDNSTRLTALQSIYRNLTERAGITQDQWTASICPLIPSIDNLETDPDILLTSFQKLTSQWFTLQSQEHYRTVRQSRILAACASGKLLPHILEVGMDWMPRVPDNCSRQFYIKMCVEKITVPLRPARPLKAVRGEAAADYSVEHGELIRHRLFMYAQLNIPLATIAAAMGVNASNLSRPDLLSIPVLHQLVPDPATYRALEKAGVDKFDILCFRYVNSLQTRDPLNHAMLARARYQFSDDLNAAERLLFPEGLDD